MEFFAILLAVIAGWIVVAVVLAVVIGRVSRAAEHEYQLSALGRDVRSADRFAAASASEAPLAEPRPTEDSTRTT